MRPVQMIHFRKLFKTLAIYITKSLGFRRSQIFRGDIIQPGASQVVPPANTGDLGSTPGLGGSPEVGNNNEFPVFILA